MVVVGFLELEDRLEALEDDATGGGGRKVGGMVETDAEGGRGTTDNEAGGAT